MYYTAALEPHNDGTGRYDVTFPDLPGCVSQGDSLEDAVRMGKEALSLHVSAMLADGDKLPTPSTLEEARKMFEQVAVEAGDPVPENMMYQYIEPELFDLNNNLS